MIKKSRLTVRLLPTATIAESAIRLISFLDSLLNRGMPSLGLSFAPDGMMKSVFRLILILSFKLELDTYLRLLRLL